MSKPDAEVSAKTKQEVAQPCGKNLPRNKKCRRKKWGTFTPWQLTLHEREDDAVIGKGICQTASSAESRLTVKRPTRNKVPIKASAASERTISYAFKAANALTRTSKQMTSTNAPGIASGIFFNLSVMRSYAFFIRFFVRFSVPKPPGFRLPYQRVFFQGFAARELRLVWTDPV